MYVKRKYSPYVVTTRTNFKNPLESEDQIKQTSSLIGGHKNHELLELLKRLGKKIKRIDLKNFVQRHAKRSRSFGSVEKRSLAELFRAVGQAILPPKLLGSKKNLKDLLRNMNLVFMAGKGTIISDSDLTRNLDLNQIEWCSDNKTLSKLAIWLAENIFWRLLYSFFYITETVAHRHEIFFFHKKDYQSIVDLNIQSLEKSNKIKAISSEKSSKLCKAFDFSPGVAICRLLPKANLESLRMITRKPKSSSTKHEIDFEFRCLLEFAIKKLFPGTVDVRGVIFHQLLSKYKEQSLKLKKFVVIVDIKDAFGSMNHAKLDAILKEICGEMPEICYLHELRYQYYGETKFFLRQLVSENAVLKREERPQIRNANFVKVTSRKVINVGNTLKMIRRRLKLHIIRLRKGNTRKHYLVNHGVLQGDNLSSALCNIYYGHLVNFHLRKYSQQGLLVRGMDDFIFVTTDKMIAEDFLQRMHCGFPDYECQIQASKTATNFTNDNFLHFCGALLDPKNLTARPDFRSYHGKNIVYASNLCMKFNQPVPEFIKNKILFVSVLSMKSLYLDSGDKDNDAQNLYEISYVTALKLHSLLASFYFAKGKQLPNDMYLKFVINKVAAKMKRTYVRLSTNYSHKLDVAFVGRIVKHAFHSVLKQKYSSFYKSQKVSKIAIKEIPEHILQCVKDRQTFRIKSHAYQRL